MTARRWLVAVAVAAVPGVLALGFGHRGVHAARSLLVPGAHVIVTTAQAQDGTLTADRVAVGKNGLTPPM